MSSGFEKDEKDNGIVNPNSIQVQTQQRIITPFIEKQIDALFYYYDKNRKQKEYLKYMTQINYQIKRWGGIWKQKWNDN